jgi:hypothetical protein
VKRDKNQADDDERLIFCRKWKAVHTKACAAQSLSARQAIQAIPTGAVLRPISHQTNALA